MARSALSTLVLLLVLTTVACGSGSVTLKAQSVTVDSVVLAGETFFLVGDAFNAMCPTRTLSLDTCKGFRLFTEGHTPSAPLCSAPTVMAVKDVLDQCGFRVAYPMVVRAYQENKGATVAAAAAAEAIIKQLTGFSKAVNTAKGK